MLGGLLLVVVSASLPEAANFASLNLRSLSALGVVCVQASTMIFRRILVAIPWLLKPLNVLSVTYTILLAGDR